MRTKKKQDTTTKKAVEIAEKLGITYQESDDPEDFLKAVMKGTAIGDPVLLDGKLRVDSAKALLSAKLKREGMHQIRKNQGIGKKEALDAATQEIMGGRKESVWAGLIN